MRRKIMVAACAFAAAVAFAAGAKTVDFPIPDAVRSWDIPERATNGVKAVWIENVPWHGKPTRFFAYYSLPEGATAEKKVPGIVLVHGGYGTAFHTWVKLWNDRGYAAIAMDNCGGIPGEKNHTAEHPRHEWSGPNGWGRYEEEALPPEEQWVYHAIECVIRSHTFLRNLPEVDASKIGVTGISWGGFLTSIACGADPRFAFAAPVYGCGNLRRHSVFAPEIGELWESLWNPVEYAKNCRIPTLWCTGTNDYFFPLDSFEETAFAAGNPLFSIKLRMKHGHPPEGDPPEIAAFADSVVKGGRKLADRKIARREWLYTESANPVWKDRPFEVSAEAPQNWTIRFENVLTEDGLILSSPPEFQTATLDAKGVVVNGATIRETERRVFADGMAMRYILPEGERRVEREETVWTLPADAKVWYQEYGMDYEKPYCSSLVSEIPVGTVMNFPVTAKLADGTYRLITEANVVGYTDSAAKYLGDGRFGVFYANDPDGFDQKGADTTPWRVMLVAKDIQTLATSDIVRRLCPDPSPEVAAKAAKFVRPGRAVWQWLPAGAPKYGEQKEWYDRTKALGFEYYLIDDGWRDWRDGDMDQWACLRKWIDYGKSIGVETFMWVDSKEMRNPETRREYLAKVKAAGAVGIKIDFHPAPSCAQMAWYEEALADTLEFGLMTDFHGCVKPSGRERTWPHEVAREAIRGHEWHITRYKRVLPPEHDCILPFNRLVQGHADYTPVVFEERELAGYTRARELAQGIIFSAPFLCFGDYPQNYLESPAAEVVKALKPIYDETIILPGSEIGECVAVAKRKDEKWFIAIENGAGDRDLEIPLSFLQSGKWRMKKFADAEDSNIEFDISECTVSPSDTLKLALRAKGGFVAVLTASAALHTRFGDGMLSVTQPRGWLGKVCHAQADGLTGHPEALSYPYDSCLWAGRIVNGRSDVDGWWRYEQTAYYTDGLLRLGYALGDSKLIAKGEKGVDYTLDNASPDGMLGDPCLWDATKHKLDSGFEMWPMAVFFRAMKAKYDATRDERIPAALAKYYLLSGADMLAKGRNTINVEGIAWTYGRTGDKRLVEMAEEAWNAKKSADNWSNDLVPAKCSDGAPIYMHGVSYSEELKIPLLLYACTGKREYLEQAVNAEWKLVRDHMLPDGCPSSTEQTRGNSVHWGHETCVVSDYTWSLGYFLEVLGDAHYADKIERCVFNAGLGSVMNDFKSLQYFSNLNQFIATSDSNHNPFFYGTTWSQYRPTHETECCAGNMHRFLPNYISRMWLKDAEGSPVAALYGPCEVDFGWARITEETYYPFDGKIVFRFGMEGEKDAAFTYRVPGWCVKGASAKVNGESVPVGDVGSFAAIRRTFRDGDTIELDFPMDTVFEVLPRRHYVIKDFVGKWTGKIEGRSVSQGTVVRRGPLVFAYQVPAERTEDTVEHASMRGKKSANPDFKCWNLRPAGPFNYALAAHEAETVADGDSVCVKVPVRRIKWELENDRFTPDLPENPVPVSDVIEYISLVPYGNTALRLAVFPDLQDQGRKE